MGGSHGPNRLGNSASVCSLLDNKEANKQWEGSCPLRDQQALGNSQHPLETELLLRANRIFLPKPG